MWNFSRRLLLSPLCLLAVPSNFVLSAPKHSFATYHKQNRDRVLLEQSSGLDAVVGGVFTGCGGPHVAHFLQTTLSSVFTQHYSATTGDDKNRVKEALRLTFDELETRIRDSAKRPAEFGFSNVIYMGATALATVVTEKYFVLANTGDNQSVVLSRLQDGKLTAITLCHLHTIHDPEEAHKLSSTHHREPDLLEHSKVKGRVDVTRAFGLLDLKLKEYDNPKGFDQLHGFQPQKSKFSGPYITHKPDFIVREVQPGDKFLLIGTSGFWQYLTPAEAAETLNTVEDPHEAAEKLLNQAKLKQFRLIASKSSPNPEIDSKDMSVVVVKLTAK